MKKIKISILIIMLLFPVLSVQAEGSSSITANSSVVNGNHVTATVTLKNMAAWNIKINGTGATDGCSVKQVGDSGSGQDITKSFTLTCKATKIGIITFSYTGDITSSDGKNKAISGSKKVTVVKPREKSSNNNLKSLSVEGYSLSPAFDKDTLEYTINVDSNVEKIKINATKEDGYASINGTGEKQVQEGDNKFQVTVTSETGKSKTYTVNIIVKDSNPIIKVIDGKRYTVVKRASALEKPDLFEETVITIKEIEIPAFYNETTKITLIGLKDEDGNIELYRYNEEIETYDKFNFLKSQSKTVIFENSNEQIEGYQKKKIIIENIEYTAYESKFNPDYVLIYGMDIETGNKEWYLYHTKEQTIQRYMDDMVHNMKENFDNSMKEYKVVLLGMSGLSLLLLLIIIVEITSKSKLKKKFAKAIQIKKEKEEAEIREEKKKEEEKENSSKKNNRKPKKEKNSTEASS